MNRTAVTVDGARQQLLGLLGFALLAAVSFALTGCGDDGGSVSGLASQSDAENGNTQPTPTATPILDEIRISVAPGEPLRIQASLHLADPGSEVAGVQNDLEFDPLLPVAARANGRPDCAYDPVTGKNGSAFGFQPPGCVPGASCNGVRAVVLSFGDTDPIPDGSGLYSCNLDTSAGAEAGRTYRFSCSNSLGGTPEGAPVAVACPDAEVTLP